MNILKYTIDGKEYTFDDLTQVINLFNEKPAHRKDIFEKVIVEQVFRDRETLLDYVTGIMGLEFMLEGLSNCKLADSDYQYYGNRILEETILNSAAQPYDFCCHDAYEYSMFTYTPKLLTLLQQHPSQPLFAWEEPFPNFHDDSYEEVKPDDKNTKIHNEKEGAKSWFEDHQIAHRPEGKIKDEEKIVCPCSLCGWIKSGKILLEQVDYLTDEQVNVFNTKQIAKLYEKNWLNLEDVLSLTQIEIRLIKISDDVKLMKQYKDLAELRMKLKGISKTKNAEIWLDTIVSQCEGELECKDFIGYSKSETNLKLIVSPNSIFAETKSHAYEIRMACFLSQYDKFKELMKDKDENQVLKLLLEEIKNLAEFDRRNILNKFERLMIRLKDETDEVYQLPLEYPTPASMVPSKMRTGT